MEPLTKLEAEVLLAALEQLREDLSQSTLKPGVENAMNSAETKLEKYVHEERCLCSECWPEGYPPGEPRVSHDRWQAANRGGNR